MSQSAQTKLTAYFDAKLFYTEQAISGLSLEDRQFAASVCHLKYENFLATFVRKNNKQWSPRQRPNSTVGTPLIGRMVAIHPNQQEKFYLHLCLKHRSCATAFASLRTVYEDIKSTYKGACISLGSRQNDSQLVECLQEAAQIASSNSIRGLFCNVIITCNPTEPEVLFNLFSEPMAEDILWRYQHELCGDDFLKELAYNDLLLALNSIFEEHGHTNAEYGIQMPNQNLC